MAKKKKKIRRKKSSVKKRTAASRRADRGARASTKKTAQRAKAKSATAAKKVQQQPPPPPVSRPGPGNFIWHELATTDAARCKDFYSRLFGWKSADEEMMPGFLYTTFKHKGQDIGGMMQIAPEQGVVTPHWTLYVSVKNVDATASECEAMGGEVVIPPHDIPVGRWALLKDPTGAAIAVFKPRSR